MGRIDQTVYDALSDILQIRLMNLEVDHPDIAVAHFNLGRLEYSRHSNDKALKHLLQYLRIASSTVQEKHNEAHANKTADEDKDSMIELDGFPNIGTFFGLGVTDTFFNPASAGPGIHEIIFHKFLCKWPVIVNIKDILVFDFATAKDTWGHNFWSMEKELDL